MFLGQDLDPLDWKMLTESFVRINIYNSVHPPPPSRPHTHKHKLPVKVQEV